MRRNGQPRRVWQPERRTGGEDRPPEDVIRTDGFARPCGEDQVVRTGAPALLAPRGEQRARRVREREAPLARPGLRGPEVSLINGLLHGKALRGIVNLSDRLAE